MKGPQMVGLKVALRGIRSNMTPLTSFFLLQNQNSPPPLPHSHQNCILRIFCFYTCTGKSPNAILFVGCINDICLDLLLRLHYVWWFQKKSTHCTATGRRRSKGSSAQKRRPGADHLSGQSRDLASTTVDNLPPSGRYYQSASTKVPKCHYQGATTKVPKYHCQSTTTKVPKCYYQSATTKVPLRSTKVLLSKCHY